VALQWLIQKEHVLPIPGAKSERQAADNAGALSFTLADAEIEALGQATTSWRDDDCARSRVQPAGERPVPGWPGSG
jgi:diketogulonate reductase-like aldo/keto reductase